MALLEDDKLMEIHSQSIDEKLLVGDIFYGRVKKLMPSLNAAYVDIGLRKDAFLHYSDLGPQLKSLLKFSENAYSGKTRSPLLTSFELENDIDKGGKIDKVLAKKHHLLVQITKEPIRSKGPRLTSEITIPGRFVVLSPFNNHVAVSKKIPDVEERKRLKMLVESIRPKNFGVIVRTAAQGKMTADLHEEITGLLDKWREIHKDLKGIEKPKKLVSELNKTHSFIRDVLNKEFSQISINDGGLYRELKQLFETMAPGRKGILDHYKNDTPIFEKYGINRQIKASFGKTSTMHSGAYLVIEHTEAMHVIDVNSGPKMQRTDQESAAYSVNVEAAKEIARQLRLRDIGGLIIVDFIDMRKQDHKSALYKAMRQYMSDDRAQHTILPLSKFGLMQITRQRTKPEVKIDTSEQCHACKGTGKSQPSILIVDRIEADLDNILQSDPRVKPSLEVHPYIFAYLTKGIPSIKHNWFKKYYKWIKVKKNNDFYLDQYKFYGPKGDEIRVTINV